MIEQEEQTVYVDWDKVELLINSADVDLRPYKSSHISYVAKRSGIPWSTIKRVKAERTTKLETIGRIARAINCNPLDIITAEGYPDPKSEALAVS